MTKSKMLKQASELCMGFSDDHATDAPVIEQGS